MKNKIFWLILAVMLCFIDLYSQQGTAFGVKFGPSAGFQKWGSRDSELLLRYHADMYVETYGVDSPYALFAQVGFHKRGGALRLRSASFQAFNSNDIITVPTRSYPYEFNNLALSVGAKQRFVGRNNTAFYYMLGVRGEYTVSTNLEDYHPEGDPLQLFNLIHPFPGSNVRKINYGVIAGGGIDFMFSELVGGMIELSISPDLSQQYFSPAFPYTQYINGSQRESVIPERKINNVSIELSLGIRLLRIVEYIDQVY